VRATASLNPPNADPPGSSGAEDGVLPIVITGLGLAIINWLVAYSVAIRDRGWRRC
jgi:hypothetical protein